VGALTSVFVDFFEKLDGGQQVSLFEVYGKLIELRFESVQIENQLKVLLAVRAEEQDENEIAKTVGEANRLCKDINLECAKLNVSVVRAQLEGLGSPRSTIGTIPSSLTKS
jgi:hypothetical protein